MNLMTVQETVERDNGIALVQGGRDMKILMIHITGLYVNLSNLIAEQNLEGEGLSNQRN